MQCTNPFFLKSQGFFVPCGKCLSCRISRTREWTLRLLHEREVTPSCVFVTLTYDDAHLSKSVSKRELQLFFKRLRKRYPKRKLRYFACGEYGDTTYRPHYHAIIYGVDISDCLFLTSKSSFLVGGCPLFDSWGKGYVHVGNVTMQSVRYVAQYVQKKTVSDTVLYDELGLSYPFQLQSQGLGLSYAEKNCQRFSDMKYCFLDGHKVSLPRYYRKKLDIDTRDLALEGERTLLEKLAGTAYGRLLPNDFLKNRTLKEHFLCDILPSRDVTLRRRFSLKNKSKI